MVNELRTGLLVLSSPICGSKQFLGLDLEELCICIDLQVCITLGCLGIQKDNMIVLAVENASCYWF